MPHIDVSKRSFRINCLNCALQHTRASGFVMIWYRRHAGPPGSLFASSCCSNTLCPFLNKSAAGFFLVWTGDGLIRNGGIRRSNERGFMTVLLFVPTLTLCFSLMRHTVRCWMKRSHQNECSSMRIFLFLHFCTLHQTPLMFLLGFFFHCCLSLCFWSI